MERKRSFLIGIVEAFLRGNLPVLIILISLVAGVMALIVTPREEEPQIVVPLADVIVSYPGGSAEEVERLVSSRLERLLYQIDGVEYVYSMSAPETAVVTVRFFVGENREDSLVKLYNKIQSNLDRVTPGIASWIVKPIEIDDVPVVTAALYSARYDTHELRRIAEEAVSRLQHIRDSARITIHGGEPRVIHVGLDTERMAAYGVTALEILGALNVSNAQAGSGAFEENREIVRVEAGPFLHDADEAAHLMVGVHGDRPIHLRDVAEVRDGPAEPEIYSRFAFGPASASSRPAGTPEGIAFNAVTIALAKKPGSNAVRVAAEAKARLEELRGTIIPDEVGVRITRDYGATADDKVNNLVQSLGLAILTVIGLLAFTMSWREGLIVALAVPITYSLTLMFNYLMGYTINRVTLFALILALGLLVDDPIAGVENIERHLRRGLRPRLEAVVVAMNEIMPPIVLSTLAIIIAFAPMFFITGMMGPYMRPMALNLPIAVLMSTVVALTVTPWLSNKLLRRAPAKGAGADGPPPKVRRLYERVVGPLVDSRRRSAVMLLAVGVLFAGSVVLPLAGLVPLKMLPFDNKNEFQVLVDLPEGSTLERTDAVVREIEDFLAGVPEATDIASTVGAASPMDFNGMVRHYYLRHGPHLGDVRVNLAHRTERVMDSHAIVLRLRQGLDEIAMRTGAALKLVEVPPGPPVLSTIVAEVYGQPHHAYDDLLEAAAAVRRRMAVERGVVDLDDSAEAERRELFFEVDRDKAGRNGVSTRDIVETLRVALAGAQAGTVHAGGEQNELPIVVRLPRAARSSVERLETLVVKGRTGDVVQIGELGAFRERTVDRTIHHKNQERVVYVTAEAAGLGPAYPVLALDRHFRENPLPPGIRIDWRGEGEWKITLDVFRDLGIAFSVALLGIYVLLVYETASYRLPVIIMLSIPMTMIGIMPGFWILNLFVNRPVGGFPNPVFFTATAMIGMIALSGIVVRNAIVLIDFIRSSMEAGRPMREAIVESGAVRFRPIVLTAGTTMLGAWPITLDPIFSGLAWALIFGLFVSTAFTLVVVPTVYGLIYGGKKAA